MRLFYFLLGLILLGLAGCAPVAVEKPTGPVFFPPAPDPPRVQFLMGIGDSRDVAGKEVQTSLFSMNQTVTNEIKSFIKPYGIVTYEDRIYVSDTLAGRVAVINLQEKSFDWLKGDFGPGKLQKPIGLATDQQGTLYVADPVRKKVLAYDPEGNFVMTYGEGKNLLPIDVTADDRRVYILDKKHRKILVFNKTSGKLLETLGQSAADSKDGLAIPTTMAMTEKGVFYVADAGRGQIVSLDRDGHMLNAFGKLGDGFGQFARPKGIGIDDQGQIYVIDAGHQNIQMFNDEGQLLMFFGDPGLPEGSLNIPAGLEVTRNGLDYFQQLAAPGFQIEQIVLATNQVDRNKIVIYGVGAKKNFDYDAYYKELREARAKEAAEQKEQLEKKEQQKKTQ